jgi:hypothetical protein
LREKFDVFLSHSFLDAEIILGVKTLLEAEGLRVYVDWIDDGQLDRSRVTSATAELLRRRMRNSRSLVYATSATSSQSKWMPWELGFFDGYRSGHVAILPLVPTSASGFKGQEYLGLYPYVEDVLAISGRRNLEVRQGSALTSMRSFTVAA